MAETNAEETTLGELAEGALPETAAGEGEQERPPSPLAFAGILLGGWLAVMIVFTIFAAIAMTVVGSMLG